VRTQAAGIPGIPDASFRVRVSLWKIEASARYIMNDLFSKADSESANALAPLLACYHGESGFSSIGLGMHAYVILWGRVSNDRCLLAQHLHRFLHRCPYRSATLISLTVAQFGWSLGFLIITSLCDSVVRPGIFRPLLIESS